MPWSPPHFAYGRVDILVNNAGICPVVKYYDVTEAPEKILDINLKGMFFSARQSLRC